MYTSKIKKKLVINLCNKMLLYPIIKWGSKAIKGTSFWKAENLKTKENFSKVLNHLKHSKHYYIRHLTPEYFICSNVVENNKYKTEAS